MSDAAYRDLGSSMTGTFTPGSEECDGIGTVRTWVRLMETERSHARDMFYERPPETLVAEGRRYAWWIVPGAIKAAFVQLRHPSTSASFSSRLAFTVMSVLQVPLFIVTLMREVPKHVLARREARKLEQANSR
jgi:hypothetical protein